MRQLVWSRRIRLLVVPWTAVVAMASVGLSAPRAHAASAVNIVAVHSGKCVETEDSSQSLDAPVVQADCTGQPGAEWYLRESPTGGGTLHVVNAGSNHCLVVPDPGAARVGTQTRQGACTATAGADFRLVDSGAEHVGLQAAAPSPALCLDVTSGSHASGTPVQLAQCYGQSGSGFVQRAPRAGNETALDAPPVLPPATVAERVNVASGGAQTSMQSMDSAPVLSGDGRYAAFTSDAASLVPGDKNLAPDVFVRDRSAGTTERVSLTDGDAESNPAEWSDEPSISGDGRYVAFESVARALVNGDTNNQRDVFVRDRVAATTQRVSVATNGTQGNSWSFAPSVSADGRYVAFTSGASNLVAGDTNGADDVFVHDRQTRTTQRVSVARRRAGQRRVDDAVPERRRAARGLHLGGVQPRGRGHQRGGGRLRTRPGVRHHPARQRDGRRGAGRPRLVVALAQRRRPPCRVLLRRHQPGVRRHQRAHRRVRTGPPGGDHAAACASPTTARRATGTRGERRSVPTDGTSRSPPAPPTSSPGTPTPWVTSSSTTVRPGRRSASAPLTPTAGTATTTRRRRPQRRRPPHRLLLRRLGPRTRRHQRHIRRVRAAQRRLTYRRCHPHAAAIR